MVKEILMFGKFETENKKKINGHKTPVLKDVDIEEKVFSVKKTISTLLVTCIMIRLNHYI